MLHLKLIYLFPPLFASFMQTGFAMLCAGSIRAKNAKNGTNFLSVTVSPPYNMIIALTSIHVSQFPTLCLYNL